ncbi:multifunctional protein thiED [Pyrenophora tritici-repentis Pt-1C-BFP]|uniref:Multifunctional protein thiED n=1 Tax=Pyrenophora tritici-repentis (strain Pt-1C-BFP) TaxID=426418 RepID=B2WEL6_PYRTR|nr:multifunctional protein thiED [Pyrenophora tritici-repentis Pt-1C-BFP]EDU51508.1 multifunctional protein thiED [Pyrenophora tritici-repentis Pt-1C-BFP]
MAPKRILVIAGSDSSGGAGLEADQKVIAAHGCYAMTATTALTAQNTLGVQDIHHTPPVFVRKQIDAVCEDVGVDVVKTVSKGEEEREVVLNVLVGESGVTVLEGEYLRSRNTHGTGCSLASAIACNLAEGMAMAKAVKKANQYIEAGIKTAMNIGSGSGPINHFHSVYMLPFTPGNFISYLLDREEVQKPWKEYTEHEFVQRMGDGTLPVEKFMYYLVQDYLFLVQFSRATALSAYKSSNLKDIGMSVQQVVTLQEEIKLHINFCKDYGLSETDVINTEEDQATTAYTRYVLDIGMSQDWLALQIALLPCLIGYGIIAKRLYEDPSSVRVGSRYWIWIEQYVADEYRQAMMRGNGERVLGHGVEIWGNPRRSQVVDQAGTSRDDE